VPRGAGTGLSGGASAIDDCIVLSVEQMRGITIDPAAMVAVVQPGALNVEVKDAARAHGLWYPPDPSSFEICSIGGNLATNAGGLNVLRYGMARALTLGIEAVMADGQVLQHLRALHKDNTGYDLTGLLVGSEGTLGVITAATLKLWPQPRSTATAFAAVPSVAAAVALLALLRALAGERVNSYELLPRSALELALRHVEGLTDPLGGGHSWYVLFELSSAADEALEGLLEQALTDATAAGLVIEALISANERQRASLWRLRETIPEAQRRAGPSLKHDIAVPVGRLADFVAQASDWVRVHVPEGRLVAYGHAGDGNLHFNISFAGDTAPSRLAELEPEVRRAVHDLVAALGGSFSAEHGIGQLKVGELQRYSSPVELAMMRSIKQALDPHGIMNPGKVLALS
jgi:FAD/FMN-containing dehydrogenase